MNTNSLHNTYTAFLAGSSCDVIVFARESITFGWGSLSVGRLVQDVCFLKEIVCLTRDEPTFFFLACEKVGRSGLQVMYLAMNPTRSCSLARIALNCSWLGSLNSNVDRQLHNPSRTSSSMAADVTDKPEGKIASAPTPRKDPLDLSFENAEAAFKSKTTWQVLRAYLVFTLCSSNYLVENNMKV